MQVVTAMLWAADTPIWYHAANHTADGPARPA